MASKQELQINTLEIMMEQNAKDHEDIKSMISSFSNKLDHSLERMEKKFSEKANKWVEKAWIWAFSCAGVVFIGLLVRWLVLIELK
jgi:Flp pilus assembly protein TadB